MLTGFHFQHSIKTKSQYHRCWTQGGRFCHKVTCSTYDVPSEMSQTGTILNVTPETKDERCFLIFTPQRLWDVRNTCIPSWVMDNYRLISSRPWWRVSFTNLRWITSADINALCLNRNSQDCWQWPGQVLRIKTSAFPWTLYLTSNFPRCYVSAQKCFAQKKP